MQLQSIYRAAYYIELSRRHLQLHSRALRTHCTHDGQEHSGRYQSPKERTHPGSVDKPPAGTVMVALCYHANAFCHTNGSYTRRPDGDCLASGKLMRLMWESDGSVGWRARGSALLDDRRRRILATPRDGRTVLDGGY